MIGSDEKTHSIQVHRQEELNTSGEVRTSVLDNLHGKQRKMSEGEREKGGKQKVGEKEWQI